MRRKNIFLAAVLSAAMVSSSVTPAFAESLTDGETAAMETAEETETETEPMEEVPETEQEPVITEVPEELPMEEIEELPMEETDELLQEEPGKLENETDVLLEASEVTEENSGTEEYTKELIAQTSASVENTGNFTDKISTYKRQEQNKIYYNAYKLYDKKKLIGVEVDQFVNKNNTFENHLITYIWYCEDDEWEAYKYSEEIGDFKSAILSGEDVAYNIWGDMQWFLRGRKTRGTAITGYDIAGWFGPSGAWDYMYTAEDVKNGMHYEEWDNLLEVPDAFYKGVFADHSKHAGLRKVGNAYYYLYENGTLAKKKKLIIDGKAYVFNENGECQEPYVAVQEKWIKKPDGYYWLQDNNTILRKGGWHTLGGSRYYLAYTSGRRKSGWLDWHENKYYLAPATGRLVTGLKTIEGNTYFLQYKTGEMVKGWKTIGKDKYYFNEQTGIMKRGMLTLNGKKYYFDKGGNRDGKQHFGWRSISGKAYFFDRKTGVMKQNTWIIDGKDKYYANKNGSRFSGIRSIKGKNYYFHTDGKLVTNKKGYKINGKKYNIDKNGVLTLVK